ncbi:hypothetical protein G9A89_000920 [Geosiphon pyriformis]|nr:hypothetical protein G9A89_000920 [Geosiphon pyriformis]
MGESPVIKQFEKETQWGVGWHGYWAQDLYTINEHFGTKKDLKRLVAEAHKKGIWVMVDVVANHMGPQRGLIPGTKQYVESHIPFNRTRHYHDYCVIGNDWNNQYKVEHCSLGGEDLPLPDLDTENPQVVNILNEWVAKLVKTYNFDGIRIDTVRHVRKDFWDGFTRSAGVFSIGEIYNQNSQYVSLYQAHLDSALNYPLFDVIAWENGVFRNPEKRIWDLRNRIDENRQWFRDTTVLGNFFDDQPIFITYPGQTLFRNVITFTLLADGIPIIYQGTEQDFAGNPNVPNGGNDPWNREALWSAQYNLTSPTSIFIANINKFRKILPSSFYKSLLVEAWIDEHVYMFLKDRVLVLVSNLGSGAKDQGGISKRSINVYTQERWDRGTEVVNVLWCYERFTVDDSGFVKIGNVNGEAKVLYPVKQLTGTGICNL